LRKELRKKTDYDVKFYLSTLRHNLLKKNLKYMLKFSNINVILGNIDELFEIINSFQWGGMHMPNVVPATAKPRKKSKKSRRKKSLRIPYIVVRLFVSIFLTFLIILGVSVYRLSQVNESREVYGNEYSKLLVEYQELENEINVLLDKLSYLEQQKDTTENMVNRQSEILNEKEYTYSQNLDEVEIKTEEIQKQVEELEKIKQDIVNQLNEVPFLPGITDLRLTEPMPMAVSYSSDPSRLLSYKLDSINKTVSAELESYQVLSETFKDIKPVLDNYPSIWPVKGNVTSGYGVRQNPMGGNWSENHTGLDIAVPAYTEVKATGGGTVKKAEYYGGYGYLVIIDHGMGLETYYAHNYELCVSAGDKVTRGQVVAKSGSTGYSTGPHVHYEVRINGNAVNPINYVRLINN